jgi:F-type H+-transporting ATPase subunit epsilon
VDVKKNNVVMLAETAERADEIDVDRAQAARERAAGRISERADGIDADRAQSALARAVNRLRIAKKG